MFLQIVNNENLIMGIESESGATILLDCVKNATLERFPILKIHAPKDVPKLDRFIVDFMFKNNLWRFA